MRGQFPVQLVEYDHQTIWVQSEDGTTLRIKAMKGIKVDSTCNNLCPHADITVDGTITICLPRPIVIWASVAKILENYDPWGALEMEKGHTADINKYTKPRRKWVDCADWVSLDARENVAWHRARIRHFMDEKGRADLEVPIKIQAFEDDEGDEIQLLDGHHRLIAHYLLKRERIATEFIGTRRIRRKYEVAQ